MNERIENLMYHAGLTAQGCWDNMDEYDRAAIEKFAELIVRGCAQFVEDKFDFFGDEIIVKEKMLEHFGVEYEEDIDETCPRCGEPDSGTSCGIPDCGWITGVEE